MAGYRFWLQSSLAVVLALAIVQVGHSQTPLPPAHNIDGGITITGASDKPVASTSPTCKIYSLSDLGDDPKLCKWVADTIPEMIQPASWKQAEVKISYYAPSKILVVNNTPAVHAQVEEFLQNMRKSLPQARATGSTGVMPAQYTAPEGPRAYGVQTGPASYPVPFAPQTPKHLFHFIIRYEGEGLIDSNVVKFAKAIKEDKAASEPLKDLTPIVPSSNSSAPPFTTVSPGVTVLPALPSVPTSVAPTTVPRMPPADAPPPPVTQASTDRVPLAPTNVPPTGTPLPAPPAGAPVPPPPPPLPF